ncbi:hypothetical protein BDZ90DRAFT_223281 [Jaminaea rosea]|uniref:Low temperature requirement A n=1 Tax=Jaminaea rosea TaxID=1569628 RepID=A0A316UK92_9BASI|nr:hypothetical protein BDZ90DRAFT_223281 [Jaminaea rosea]PWN25667.1 hypothetical protein BDZ90DRAFT_223281 [Jaminaea rosea]
MTAEPEEVVRPSPAPLQPTSSSSASSAQAYNHPQHHSQQQQVRDESEIFQLAHGRRKKPGSQDGAPAVSFIEVYDEQQPIRLSHLFRRPVIRQFLSDGRIYREKFERESSRFELFFDLCFVGIIHQLADGLGEAESGRALQLLKFALIYYPAYSVALDVRSYINTSGLDDVWCRLYLLLQMLLLIGYTANATAVEIISEHKGIVPEGMALLTLAESSSESSPHLAHGAGDESLPLLAVPLGKTGLWFAEGYLSAIIAAGVFNLASKLLKVLLLFVYGIALPRFRRSLWLSIVPTVCLAAIYLPIPAIPVADPAMLLWLLVAGIVCDILFRFGISYTMQFWHGRAKRHGHSGDTFIPVTSVEHSMERSLLFTLLVIGESILNATFKAEPDSLGLSQEYGRSVLAVIVGFTLIWLYFDADGSRCFVHALRRNPFTAISFNLAHFVLTGSLILMSSALPGLIHEVHSKEGVRWFFGGSMATSLGVIAILGLLHKNLDKAGSAKWPYHARIALRFVVSAGFAVIPLNEEMPNTHFLTAYAVLLVGLVASETFGKLGAVGRRYDPLKAEKYYARQKEETHKRRRSRSASLDRRSSWHYYADLGGDERGDEDVGIEGEIGQMEIKDHNDAAQRWALLAL